MLTDADLAFMRRQQDLGAPATEQPVTFYRYAGMTKGDRAAGTADTPVYAPPTGIPLTAVANLATLTTGDQVGGRVTLGDVVFQIRVSVLAGKPTPNDRVEWTGARYKPVRITEAHLQGALFWVVRGERL